MRSIIAIKDNGQDHACMDPGRLAYIAYFRSALCCTLTNLAEATKIDNPINFASTFSLHSFLFQKKAHTPPPCYRSEKFSRFSVRLGL